MDSDPEARFGIKKGGFENRPIILAEKAFAAPIPPAPSLLQQVPQKQSLL